MNRLGYNSGNLKDDYTTTTTIYSRQNFLIAVKTF